jgi:hypothetical protein
MTTYSGLFAAALIALILTVVSVFFLGKRGPWGSIWTFFLVLFLTLSTVAIYVAPIGPVYWGIAWIPITIAGVIITVLLIAAMPHPDNKRGLPNGDTDVTKVNSKTDFPTTPVGRFFWALIILFVIAIIVGMANPQVAL